MAAAETPSPILMGAQQVVLSCEISGDLPGSAHQALCEQLVKKAQRYTDLPVRLAGNEDLRLGLNMRKQANQLLLRVHADAKGAGKDRKTLALEVSPVRIARPGGSAIEPARSSATLVEVEGAWLVQGPIDAFERLLGGRKKPHVPLTSDS